MARKVEYRNELGVMFSIINGIKRVYQDIPDESYTFINIWIDGKLVGSIKTDEWKMILNLLPRHSIPTDSISVDTIPF